MRNHLASPSVFCLALVLALGRQPLSAQQPELATRDGRRFPAQLVSLDPQGQLAFRVGQQSGELAASDLLRWGDLSQPKGGPLVFLAQGGWLQAEVLTADETSLRVQSDSFGPLTLPRAWVRGVAWRVSGQPEELDRLLDQMTGADSPPAEGRPQPAAGSADRVWLENGDYLSGPVAGLTDQRLEIDSPAGPLEVELASVRTLVLAASGEPPPPARFLVCLADGSQLPCQTVRRTPQGWQLELSAEHVWSLGPRSQSGVVGLFRLAGPLVFLSDLEPAGYRHVPFLELSWPYRMDRAVSGRRLRVAGRTYPKGVGLHSASRLTWRLDGLRDRQSGRQEAVVAPLTRFRARLAIDDEAGSGGSLVGRVFLDSEVKFTSPVLRGGSGPVDIDLELGSARSLSLVVDFAERGDQLDHADWLEARLEP